MSEFIRKWIVRPAVVLALTCTLSGCYLEQLGYHEVLGYRTIHLVGLGFGSSLTGCFALLAYMLTSRKLRRR